MVKKAHYQIPINVNLGVRENFYNALISQRLDMKGIHLVRVYDLDRGTASGRIYYIDGCAVDIAANASDILIFGEREKQISRIAHRLNNVGGFELRLISMENIQHGRKREKR